MASREKSKRPLKTWMDLNNVMAARCAVQSVGQPTHHTNPPLIPPPSVAFSASPSVSITNRIRQKPG